MMNKQEIRSFTTSVEIRDGTNGRVICGYPIVFDKPSQDLGGFVEYIDPHALAGVNLSEVYLVRSHEMDHVLARVDSGTLSLKVDDKGLYFEASLPNTTLANDTLEDIRVGNIKGMSFMFTTKKDSWNENLSIRTVLQIDEVYEITLTPMPAYQDTSVVIAKRDVLLKTNTKEMRERAKALLFCAKARQEVMDGKFKSKPGA
ncbi:HK97 family phage prohead protease [Lactovum odontotermitis]